MPYALQRGDVAGAVVVIVKDGQVLLEKGYGYSDVAKRAPVDPKTTLFRPGSTSKLFTWTAVMQLVEEGKLNLDRDVNDYLDFKIPPRNGQPITLRNIMTHTPGFEETIKGLIEDDPKHLGTLEQVVKRWTPNRIFDAGTTPAYSNYATALAGYIVQRVSGQSFDDYVDQHIFKPLDMNHASFRQPLEPELLAHMSNGYTLASGEPHKYELVPLAPAGSLALTGDDMSHFMIAHLQDGHYGSAEILKPETAEMMHTTALTMIPPLHRMDLGFYEQDINGHKVIAHGGDTQYFHSYLFLFPKDKVGLFISVNSVGKDGAASTIREQFFEKFSDRYFPRIDTDGQVDSKTAADHAKMMVGLYDSSRRPDRSFLSIINLLGQAKIIANKDGTISFSMMRAPGGALMHFREIAPFVWRDVNGHDRLAAVVKDGKVVRFSEDEFSPFMVLEPVSPGKSSSWLVPAVMAALAALALTLLFWPVSVIVRTRYGKSFPLEGRRAQSHRLVRGAALVAFAAAIGWVWAVAWLLGGGLLHAADIDGMIHLIQALTLLGFIGGLLVALYNAWVVWTGGASWFGKLWSIVLVLALLVLLWTAWCFHLLGFGVLY